MKVGIVSLGCDKNRVDSEMMMSILTKNGFEICGDPTDAEVLIVNTCAFLESSRQEAINTIIEMSHYKSGKCKLLVATGCLGQKFGDEVFDLLTEADVVCGINEYERLPKIIKTALSEGRQKVVSPCSDYILHCDRVLTTPKHYAYLKIADGCNNFCSYCLIPYIRGRYRSVPMEQLLSQAAQLVDGGVSEFILVAQDVTAYGKDIYGGFRIVELLRTLSRLEGLRRIRLLYCYPEIVSDELIAEIDNNPKVCKYIDIPLQHVNDDILKRMNRHSTYSQICSLFDKLLSAKHKIAIRTTFICGFPGESVDSFEQTLSFLRRYRLDNVGAFAFSPEQGTAAYNMSGRLCKSDCETLVKKLYETQHEIVAENNNSAVGKSFLCVVDSEEENAYVCRSEYQCPDIDSVVLVDKKVSLAVGEYVKIKIVGVSDDGYDLIGELL